MLTKDTKEEKMKEAEGGMLKKTKSRSVFEW